MNYPRTVLKGLDLPGQPRIAQKQSFQPAPEQPLRVWWIRAATIMAMGYVLFSQTLHAISGWSRLGIAFAALLMIVLLLGRVSGAWSFKTERWMWIPAPFVVYCLIRGIPAAGNDWPSEELFPLVCAFCGGIGTALALQVAVPFRAIAYAQAASNLCNIVAALVGIGTDQPGGGDEVRYSGITGNANSFGLELALGACLIWLLPKKAGLLPCLLAFVSISYAVFTSGSRTALTVVPFFLVLAFVQIVVSLKKYRAAFIISVIAVLLLIGITLGSAILGSAERITAVNRLLEHDDSSFDTRVWMMQKGIELWHKAPFLGNGLDGFERLSGHPGYAHNNFVELLCNTGLVGFLLFYCMHGFILLKSIWLKEPLRLYSCGLVLMLLAIDMGTVNYISKQTVMILLILLSIPVVQGRVRLPQISAPALRS